MQASKQAISVPPAGKPGPPSDPGEKRKQSIVTLLRSKPRCLSELSRETSTSTSLVHKDLRALVKEGIIFKKASMEKSTRPGRPAVYYDLVPKRVRILCPACNKTGTIEINKDLAVDVLDEQGTGLLEMHVFSGEICNHALAIIIDGKFAVRNVVPCNC